MSDNYLSWFVEALKDLIKFGIPLTFYVDHRNAVIFIKSKRGSIALSIIPLLDPVTGDTRSVGIAQIGSSYYITIGFMNKISEHDIVTVDYIGLLRALANEVLTVYEIDLWALRLAHRDKLRDSSDIPKWLAWVKERGLRVMELTETCDYAIGVNDVMGVWVNYCTGRVDIALEEQEKMNVIKWGHMKDFLINWVKQLESV